MSFLTRDAIRNPVLDQWGTDEVLTVLAAAQNLPDDEPGKEGLLEEAIYVKEVLMGTIAGYELCDEHPKVAEAKDAGLLDKPPTAEDLGPVEYSKEEAHQIEIATIVYEYFEARSKTASLKGLEPSISPGYVALLSQALQSQATNTADPYRAAASQRILETRGLLPQPTLGAKILQFLHLR